MPVISAKRNKNGTKRNDEYKTEYNIKKNAFVFNLQDENEKYDFTVEKLIS